MLQWCTEFCKLRHIVSHYDVHTQTAKTPAVHCVQFGRDNMHLNQGPAISLTMGHNVYNWCSIVKWITERETADNQHTG